MKYQAIYEYINQLPMLHNTHCHHLADSFYENVTLHQLMQMTYISWMYPFYEDKEEGRRGMMDTMCTNTYFVWMARAIGELYGDGTPLNVENWDSYDAKVREAYQDKEYRYRMLKERCRYSHIILDDYMKPGDNHGHGDLMRPAYRCDMFLFGYHKDAHDENNNSAYQEIGFWPTSFAAYLQEVRAAIYKKQAQGTVCIKIAIAYERGLDFTKTNYEEASAIYGKKLCSKDELKCFQDFMMFEIAKVAAELQMPIQIHTGLGGMERSGAKYLVPLIKSAPDTTFVIFHCSYPWTQDALGLLHNFKNVIVDLCWLPLISRKAAIDFVKEALQVGDHTRICWGCDTWTVEESYGAILAITDVLSVALEELSEELQLSEKQVKGICHNIMFENANRIYRF